MFELDGNQYSTEDLQKAAKRYNMEYDTYLKVMIDKGLKEISPAKTIDPASADPTVVSSNNTGSTGDQDSSGSAKYNAYKIGGAEVKLNLKAVYMRIGLCLRRTCGKSTAPSIILVS